MYIWPIHVHVYRYSVGNRVSESIPFDKTLTPGLIGLRLRVVKVEKFLLWLFLALISTCIWLATNDRIRNEVIRAMENKSGGYCKPCVKSKRSMGRTHRQNEHQKMGQNNNWTRRETKAEMERWHWAEGCICMDARGTRSSRVETTVEATHQ